MDGHYGEEMMTAWAKAHSIRSLVKAMLSVVWEANKHDTELGRKHNAESLCAELCELEDEVNSFGTELRQGTLPHLQLISDLRCAMMRDGADWARLEELSDLESQVRTSDTTAQAGAALAARLSAVVDRIEPYVVDLVDFDFRDMDKGKERRDAGHLLIGLAWALRDQAALLPQ